VAGAAQTDDAGAMFLSFLDCQFHGKTRRDLADVMFAVDHGGDFTFALDAGFSLSL
jgi:hypothetical protein